MRPDMQRARGVTLIELVIVTVILGIMAAVLAPLMLSSVTAYDTIQDNVAVLDKQRYAIERLAREIREVNDTDASANTAFAINMNTTEPVFTRTYRSCTNADCSSATDTSAIITVGQPGAISGFTGNCVTLTVTLTDGSTTAVLVDEVGSLAFAYFDNNGTGTVDATAVRYVEISLTLRHNNNDYLQRTRVELKSH